MITITRPFMSGKMSVYTEMHQEILEQKLKLASLNLIMIFSEIDLFYHSFASTTARYATWHPDIHEKIVENISEQYEAIEYLRNLFNTYSERKAARQAASTELDQFKIERHAYFNQGNK